MCSAASPSHVSLQWRVTRRNAIRAPVWYEACEEASVMDGEEETSSNGRYESDKGVDVKGKKQHHNIVRNSSGCSGLLPIRPSSDQRLMRARLLH